MTNDEELVRLSVADWWMGTPGKAVLRRGNVKRLDLPNGEILTMGLGLDRQLVIELTGLGTVCVDLTRDRRILIETGKGVDFTLFIHRNTEEVVELADKIGADNARQRAQLVPGPRPTRIGLAGDVDLFIDPENPTRLRLLAKRRWVLDFEPNAPYAFLVCAEGGTELWGMLLLD